jgi:DNA invertase Pin-like site-specific DNA recombinase
MSKPVLRCAIYTRKSSEEGLDQAFNSLDAQREAGEAYVRSQRHEGWLLLPERYDDGGISGGTLERPALQRLLAEIRAGRVQVIVVYKVDRLTRALSDFARLVELFDTHGVSFVSITQQFNTTTSMGRLTLNVLLSFAQFEREVTGERIRDKIAASKRKGMWMGGCVPLGYDAVDRTLIVNAAEADAVRWLFRTYLDSGSVERLQTAAVTTNVCTKSGKPFTRGHLYRVLQNPVYIGQIRHHEQVYAGQHSAIVERSLWEAVQARLAGNRVARRDGRDHREPSLLAGRLVDDQGHGFTPSHAVKQGRRYRYYVERRPTSARPGKSRRLPAQEIEQLVIETLSNLMASTTQLLEATELDKATATTMHGVANAGLELAKRLTEPTGRNTLIRALVSRVVLIEAAVQIDIDRTALRAALHIAGPAYGAASFTITIPVRLRFRGVELKLIVPTAEGAHCAQPDASLIKAVIRGHAWWHRRLSGDAQSIADIAATEGINDRYIRRLMGLAFLAPDIIERILDGQQPVELTTEQLVKHRALPIDWAEQRRLFGFD